ncbi:MAG: acyclic terpene utilization AtuA family protein [Chloroflexi bacterium]|nr:acyclic terpene utilization AtuA family protein [Chloroflexota bacterium]
MREVCVLTPTGCIGNRGTHKESFLRALADEQPDVIATDAGSLDPGPYYLGAGREHSPIKNIRWDLELLLTEAVPRKIPIVIGSAGGSGARAHVDQTLAIIREIAAAQRLHFTMAVIYADVDLDYLRRRARHEAIRGVDHDGALTPEAIDQSAVVVAMMGCEPIIKALEMSADVVVAGRASDACTIAAYPIWKGCSPGIALHLGDVVECGEACASEREPMLRDIEHNRIPMVGRIRDDHFLLRPAHKSMACTPQSCAAHALYERADIYHTTLPGGALDKTDSRYEVEDPWTVRISGARFTPAEPYTVLLEGVRQVGYRAILVFGVRTPRMLAQLDGILEGARAKELALFGGPENVAIHYHLYGRNGVLGDYEFAPSQAHEVGVVVDVVAKTQELAHDVTQDLRSRISFWRYEGRQTTAGNVAVPFSPSVIDVGPAYALHIYHALPLKNGNEIFPVVLERV